MKPLVSILIPAFNSQEWIGDTLRSAIAQTWPSKEIIVVDDGSVDQTLAIAQLFESGGVQVVTQKNGGASAARNRAFSLSKGDYVQWLDADDLLAPDKIARQMQVLSQLQSKRTLISSAWASFMYKNDRAKFVPTALWRDQSPAEWLLTKMGQHLFMPDFTWLVSRELTEEAGPWDTSLHYDDDGEYFSRVLTKCDGVRFVPEAKAYYRASGSSSVSYIGQSDRKMESLFRSIELHISYLCSLEDSQRARSACVSYLQTCLIYFYPERPDIIERAEQLANRFGGRLDAPHLSWKYSWIRALFGWGLAKRAKLLLPRLRWYLQRSVTKAMLHRGKGRCDVGVQT
jgi:glycosyltransferase involved in cell wall biosynthesis